LLQLQDPHATVLQPVNNSEYRRETDPLAYPVGFLSRNSHIRAPIQVFLEPLQS